MISILEETKFLLKQNKILPSKSKGQNFLISEEVLNKIIQSANLKSGENILEIGPGIGTLTEALLKEKVNLKVIELDRELIEILDPLAKKNNFEIIFVHINYHQRGRDSEKDEKFVRNYFFDYQDYFILEVINEKVFNDFYRYFCDFRTVFSASSFKARQIYLGIYRACLRHNRSRHKSVAKIRTAQ